MLISTECELEMALLVLAMVGVVGGVESMEKALVTAVAEFPALSVATSFNFAVVTLMAGTVQEKLVDPSGKSVLLPNVIPSAA